MLGWLWQKKDKSEGILSTKKTTLWSRFKSIFEGRDSKNLEDILLEIEDLLVSQDVGIDVSEKILLKVRQDVSNLNVDISADSVYKSLKLVACEMMPSYEKNGVLENSLEVVFFVGINGVGKTTTLAKVAYLESLKGRKVILAAADTFRAAACEQLDVWSKRVGVDIVKGKEKADPSSVVYAAAEQAVRGSYDLLLVDTAGRLHNKVGLMNELAKMKRTILKVVGYEPQEILLVIDATMGQSAFDQVETFKEVVDVSSLVLTKLDGATRGGIGLGLTIQFGVPVKYLGYGEKMEDLKDFSKDLYIEELFSKN